MSMAGYELCPRCGGDGVVARGSEMRRLRKVARKGLNETAERMGISAAYLCDLEHGRRGWSPELAEKFRKAIK